MCVGHCVPAVRLSAIPTVDRKPRRAPVYGWLLFHGWLADWSWRLAVMRGQLWLTISKETDREQLMEFHAN